MHLSQQMHHWPGRSESPFASNRYERSDDAIRNPEGRSLLTGPITATVGYDYDTRVSSALATQQGFARVHGSDARAIHQRGTSGTGVASLFEVKGTALPARPVSAAKPPIDHVNANVRRIRHMTREAQQRQANKEHNHNHPTPVKDLWKSKQYDHVQSKVKQKLDEDTRRSISRPQSARGNFLQAHERTGPERIRSQSISGSRRGSVASLNDLPGATTKLDDRSQPDYVRLNSRWVGSVPKVRKAATEEVLEKVREKQDRELQAYHERQKGRVPNYIERMRERQAQQIYDERASARDPDCPPGHARVDNEQCQATLRQLESHRSELMKRLNHLPIRNDSLTLRRAKEEIEKKIIELDEAIKIFSKPKVFVKMEE